MSSDPAFQEKLLALVAEGKISPADADALLQAAPRKAPAWKALWDPFAHLQERSLLALAVAALLAWVALAPLGCRFDGALDLHLGLHRIPARTVALDLAVAWPFTALCLWLAARPWARRTRYRDLLAWTLVARIPDMILVAGLLLGAHVTRGALLTTPKLLGLASLAALPFVVGSTAWLVLALRSATGLRGGRLTTCAVLGLLGAEVLSKILLIALS